VAFHVNTIFLINRLVKGLLYCFTIVVKPASQKEAVSLLTDFFLALSAVQPRFSRLQFYPQAKALRELVFLFGLVT
jgi:hypothetical protein